MTSPATCSHLDALDGVRLPERLVCEECEKTGSTWVHLRTCQECGTTRCCDSSPNRHATAHWREHPDHPLVRSYEPGEDWWWCYPEELSFEVDGAPPAPSHP